jgi:hypothetical protein
VDFAAAMETFSAFLMSFEPYLTMKSVVTGSPVEAMESDAKK